VLPQHVGLARGHTLSCFLSALSALSLFAVPLLLLVPPPPNPNLRRAGFAGFLGSSTWPEVAEVAETALTNKHATYHMVDHTNFKHQMIVTW
jgi:hypothetical protein